MDIEQLKKRVDATARYVEALENAIENKKERIEAEYTAAQEVAAFEGETNET